MSKWVLPPHVASAGLCALLAGERVGVMRGGDTLQLGADVVLDGAPAQSMAREMRAVG